MKTELTQSEKDSLLPNIRAVLKTGKSWEDKDLHHPAGAIIDSILEISGMAKKETDEGNGEGFDTNGWQWDWWQHFTHDGKEYTLSGSGYYGGHAFNISNL